MSDKKASNNAKPVVKVKTGVLLLILAIAVSWIIYMVLPLFQGSGPGKPLDTAGWRLANEITQKLVADHDLADVGISVESEKPLKLKASGVVHGPANLGKLKELLGQSAPGTEIEYDVSVTPM